MKQMRKSKIAISKSGLDMIKQLKRDKIEDDKQVAREEEEQKKRHLFMLDLHPDIQNSSQLGSKKRTHGGLNIGGFEQQRRSKFSPRHIFNSDKKNAKMTNSSFFPKLKEQSVPKGLEHFSFCIPHKYGEIVNGTDRKRDSKKYSLRGSFSQKSRPRIQRMMNFQNSFRHLKGELSSFKMNEIKEPYLQRRLMQIERSADKISAISKLKKKLKKIHQRPLEDEDFDKKSFKSISETLNSSRNIDFNDLEKYTSQIRDLNKLKKLAKIQKTKTEQHSQRISKIRLISTKKMEANETEGSRLIMEAENIQKKFRDKILLVQKNSRRYFFPKELLTPKASKNTKGIKGSSFLLRSTRKMKQKNYFSNSKTSLTERIIK